MPSQFDLFGEPLPTPEAVATSAPVAPKRAARSAVLAARPSAAALAAAASLPANIYLGTSSWSYAGWNGLVYDDTYPEPRLARDGLGAYAAHPLFRTVGIDRTFYAPIAEKDYARYAAQVPEGFRFVVKAPMAITSSYMRSDEGVFSDSPYFLDIDYAIDEFIAPCTAGLGAKAGPLVFQFPPQGREATRNPDLWINRLYRFLRELPPGFLYAVEIRDPELLTPRFLACLKTTGVQFCVASHARMPPPAKQIEAAAAVLGDGPLVARWSLHTGFNYAVAKARYFPFDKLVDEDPDSRSSLAAACLRAVAGGHAAFVIVNNKAEGSSPLSIEKLAALVSHVEPTPPTD
jgi:uncharacterized protein YecE (DUF72 family)